MIKAIVVLILLQASNCMSTNYDEFKPVYVKNGGYVIENKSLDTEFVKNIQIVFKFYSVQYKFSETGKLLVPPKLWQNKDLMWNYTTKANDPQWIQTHLDH